MTENAWEARKLATAAELDPRPVELPPEVAQEWCNFTLFLPERLPAGTSLGAGTVRREAPPGRVGEHTAGRTPWSENNPSAHRFEITGRERRLRVKQFLYDWAFPALGHPCLWESGTQAEPVDEHHVLWFGTDYAGKPGASARIARTLVELSVLEGEFSRAELLDLYRSLRPVAPGVAERVGATPFHGLSYWARRPEAHVIAVPLGLWRVRQSGNLRLVWSETAHTARDAKDAGLPDELGGLALDSFARETGGEDWTELEVVYSGGRLREKELRLHVYRRSPVQGAPERDDHPGTFEELRAGGRTVRLASIDSGCGPFDALVESPDGGQRLRLMSGTGVGCDRQWFLGALNELVPQADTLG
ncbi:hypothetical protein [Streptomyces sp. HNM0574]|uniref:hypothetical protein n=1 Tax=Streptomyces sp. HNM0574 TaxID=2714954 RepID=UPI00146C94F0|nr:hypothetical protein [Streptomyces sp. HNM0574]NLU70759.1 hypothetical protein [Streptomyces sp. HNM0574]